MLATWKKGIDNIPGEPVARPRPYQVDLMRYPQWRHVNDILERPQHESCQARIVPDFRWARWINPAKRVAEPHTRSDAYLKNYPNRARPIDGPP